MVTPTLYYDPTGTKLRVDNECRDFLALLTEAKIEYAVHASEWDTGSVNVRVTQ